MSQDPWEERDADWDFAMARLSKRADVARVEKELVGRGLTPAAAHELLERARDALASVRRRAGALHMLGGLALAMAGVAATVFTYGRAATSPEGGKYTIWYGPVFAGIAYFFFGFTKFRRARPEAMKRRPDRGA